MLKHLLIVISVAVYSCMTTQVVNAANKDYQSQTALEKQTYIYDQCQAKAGTEGQYASATDTVRLLIRNINPTFDHASDKLPYKGGKPIHSIGYITKAKFEPLDNAYTGVFQGTDTVIIRLSLTAKPKANSIMPGASLKFLRTNIRSANFVTLYSFDGQESLNFFENALPNHVPIIPNPSIAQKLLLQKFRTGSKIPTFVGLSDLASYGNDGTPVASANVVFPYEVKLVPITGFNYTFDELGLIPSGTKIYDFYALDSPTSTEWKNIGSFTTTSALIKCEYGDNVLFFQHQRYEDDLALRPEWKNSRAVRRYLRAANETTIPRCPMGYS